tara:strand:- start:62 stop:484 length:423 start_codon:yes stop_codon:yes gene_type:complete
MANKESESVRKAGAKFLGKENKKRTTLKAEGRMQQGQTGSVGKPIDVSGDTESKDFETFVNKKKGGGMLKKKKKGFAMGGSMKKKGFSKGGSMKKKGFAKGGMAKKGYAMGGKMKKGYAKGGKVRGAGIAQRGVRPAKMR